eukprot:TRINITY_DN3515_c0_g1_i3.p1 TRINITY_DN3515_c0_g1~~TRINITY_DN3515_c0_g1_i3.p1  ORF type:complete len:377 (-),score=116.67 TRINITY_DN3515_c0_g1_i3:23-1153(-)
MSRYKLPPNELEEKRRARTHARPSSARPLRRRFSSSSSSSSTSLGGIHIGETFDSPDFRIPTREEILEHVRSGIVPSPIGRRVAQPNTTSSPMLQSEDLESRIFSASHHHHHPQYSHTEGLRKPLSARERWKDTPGTEREGMIETHSREREGGVSRGVQRKIRDESILDDSVEDGHEEDNSDDDHDDHDDQDLQSKGKDDQTVENSPRKMLQELEAAFEQLEGKGAPVHSRELKKGNTVKSVVSSSSTHGGGNTGFRSVTDELMHTLEALTSHAEETKLRMGKLEAEKNGLRDDVDKIMSKNVALEKRVCDLERENMALKGLIGTADDGLRGKVEDLHAEVQRLRLGRAFRDISELISSMHSDAQRDLDEIPEEDM